MQLPLVAQCLVAASATDCLNASSFGLFHCRKKLNFKSLFAFFFCFFVLLFLFVCLFLHQISHGENVTAKAFENPC